MPDTEDLTRFLPLPSASLHILLSLREGERHGYAVMRDVERLLADGLIEESAERPDPELDDQRRRYYRLTGLGERVCSAEVERLSKLLQRAGGGAWKPGRTRLGEA